ncbi:MAG: hypothetical protein HQL53_10510 [Magnetococcales bacterium]|nr:hypothetical protein [Magnetococcales bacterium]
MAVIGHNEISSKTCPGFDVQEWLRGRPLPFLPGEVQQRPDQSIVEGSYRYDARHAVDGLPFTVSAQEVAFLSRCAEQGRFLVHVGDPATS